MDRQRRIRDIASWWTSASDEERFLLMQRALKAEAKSPTLEEVRLAAIVSEADEATRRAAEKGLGGG